MKPKLCCELLSDFVYSFFEHNLLTEKITIDAVVNCFQILYIRSLNTIFDGKNHDWFRCELLSDFVYSFFEHNAVDYRIHRRAVVNCFQILYIRSLNTILAAMIIDLGLLWIAFRFCIFVLWTQFFSKGYQCHWSCELLSDFVYSFFEHNQTQVSEYASHVVNCFQILYIRSLNTIGFV